MEELRNLEEHDAFVNNVGVQYRMAESESRSKKSDSLLLPIQTYSKVSLNLATKGLKISSINRIAVETIVAEAEKKKRTAELDAQIYRNLAEQLKKEKRELNNTLNRKIETVRDFWRNHLCEGASRGGRMVRAAIDRKKN